MLEALEQIPSSGRRGGATFTLQCATTKLFEIALVLVRFDHVASVVVNTITAWCEFTGAAVESGAAYSVVCSLE